MNYAVALTRSETQIIEQLHAGASNAEIASRLGMAEGTVKVYLSRQIYPKLNAANRVEAALWAERSGRFPAPRDPDPRYVVSFPVDGGYQYFDVADRERGFSLATIHQSVPHAGQFARAICEKLATQ